MSYNVAAVSSAVGLKCVCAGKVLVAFVYVKQGPAEATLQ
jgi:hypothetical protein